MDGWIKMYRKSLTSSIWVDKPSTWYKVWQYILLNVNHKDKGTLKKGQGLFNFTQEQKAIGVDVTYSVIDHALRFLKSAKQIATQKAKHGTIVTVLNYKLYQSDNVTKSETESEILSEVKAKPARNLIYIKERKNDKNLDTNVSNGQPEINRFISLFAPVNPSYKQLYPQKGQRQALERMINEHGTEKVEWAIRSLPHVYGKPYAPMITTPYELEKKLGALIAYLQKEQGTVNKFSVTKV